MITTSLKRIILAGWRNFSRDGGLLFANLFIMTMVISLVTSLFFFQIVSQFLINNLQEKVDIAVYFKTDSFEDDILQAKEEIAKIPEVKEVKYVSKKEALENFVERHKDNSVLMESLLEIGANPFLASLNIRAFQAQQYQAVANFLENSDFVDSIEKVDYLQRKPVIERIFSLTSNLNLIGIIFSLILAIIAVLVAFNSIRLAIYNSREEIKIQRLVGASNWFIRGPFLVQGTIVGVLAAFIAFFIFLLASLILNSKIAILFPSLNIFQLFLSSAWLLFLIQLFSGVGLGIISSLIAIRRYLEV